MSDKVNYSRYIPLNSIVHSLSSSCKLLSLIIMIISIFFIDSYTDVVMLGTYLILAILYTNINIKYYLKNIYSVKVFLLFIILIDIIFYSGTAKIVFDSFKIIFMILYGNIIIYTTSSGDITYGIERILSPFKRFIPVSDIALVLTLTMKYIPLCYNEGRRIIRVQSFRGGTSQKTIKNKIDMISNMLVPMFIISLKRAFRIGDIMEMRLYGYSNNRTSYKSYKYSFKDYFVILLNILILLVVIIY